MDLLAKTDFDALFEECRDHLINLIRINTVNPPGNEKAAAEYIAETLLAEGLKPEVLESTPGRANMVVKIKGDGSARPLLMCGHLDVVGAEPRHWSHDPFGGAIAEGCIWGRGSLDMKNMLAMEMSAMLALARSGLTPSRDLIFCAVADEEAGCKYGSKWMLENHQDRISAEYVIGEIGGFSVPIGRKTIYPIQIAEKGTCWVRITAYGDPGHGSVPHKNSAVTKIGKAAFRIAGANLPQHSTPAMKTNIRQISAALGWPYSMVLPALLNKRLSGFILNKLFSDKALARTYKANLHNTANPTILRAGEKINVIPSSASMEIDGRILPGQTNESFIQEIKKRLGPGYHYEILQSEPPVEGSADDPVFDIIQKVIADHDHTGVAVASQLPAFTDAKFFSKTGAKYLGFSPVQLTKETNFIDLIHGHNERIPIDGLRWGLKVFLDFIGRTIG